MTAPAATPAGTLLQLMWLASPALPVGGFSYSEGLEAAVEAGRVGAEADVADWLSAQLQLALARSDLPALAQAHAAWQAHDVAQAQTVNDWLRTTRESAEFRAQAEQRRVERFQIAEKLAMEAPVKLIFPLVVFIFPVTFLVLMFPIAMKFLESGIKL